MKEASPLKVREYLALGLPVIIKYHDSDFLGPKPYILQLPNDGRPLKDFATELNDFLSLWADSRVPRSEITHLDVSTKEKIRLEFLQTVLDESANQDLLRG